MNFKKTLAFVMAVAIFVSVQLPLNANANNKNNKIDIKGIVVNSADNIDFPSHSNLSVKALSGELSDIVSYVSNNGLNTVFFEARPNNGALYKSKIYKSSSVWVDEDSMFSFFDPLKDLVKKANKCSVGVYAIINPLIPPVNADDENSKINYSLAVENNLKDIRNICRKYEIEGVIFKNLPTGEGYQNFEIDSFLINAKKQSNGKNIGVLFNDGLYCEQQVDEILKNSDLVLPVVNDKAQFENEGYIERLNVLNTKNENIIPVSDVKNAESITAKISINHFLSVNNGFDSFVFDGFDAMSKNKFMQESLLLTVEKKDKALFSLMPKYDPIQKLTITRPTSKITSPYSTYFIMGTSNPKQPLYFNQKQLERKTKDGVFGVLVNLNVGTNTFYFSQNGVTKTVNIKRTSPSSTKVVPINKITTTFPRNSAVFKNGMEQIVSCVAPSGAKVSATVAGTTVNLAQNATASIGTPAVYSGKIIVNGVEESKIKDIGKVTYTLTYNGVTTSYPSKGNIYLKGSNAKSYVSVNSQYSNVLTPNLKYGEFKSIYKKGTMEEVVDTICLSYADYYELKSGGFINTKDVDVLENKTSNNISIKNVTSVINDKDERIILPNVVGLPYYFQEHEDGSTTINIFGDISLCNEKNRNIESKIYSSVNFEKTEDGIKINLTPKDKNDIWGIDVIYDGDNTILYTNKRPKISKNALKPLSDLKIVIDPGHGGIDSGALGILGVDSPSEKHLNFANALMLKNRLEKLGATVILTRYNNNDNPTLLDRVEVAYDNYTDIFISLHHNSIVEAADGNKHEGVEAFYYESFGEPFSKYVVSNISQNVADRKLRKNECGYYIVTKMRCAPAILTEIGFMSSPIEYGKSCDEDEIFKTSEAITVSIMQMMDKQ